MFLLADRFRFGSVLIMYKWDGFNARKSPEYLCCWQGSKTLWKWHLHHTTAMLCKIKRQGRQHICTHLHCALAKRSIRVGSGGYCRFPTDYKCKVFAGYQTWLSVTGRYLFCNPTLIPELYADMRGASAQPAAEHVAGATSGHMTAQEQVGSAPRLSGSCLRSHLHASHFLHTHISKAKTVTA